MTTTHQVIIGDSRKASEISSNSIALTVTSPPYPMIEMWDKMFSEQSPEVGAALKKLDGNLAFELMHKELDKVWAEVARVTINGGFVAVNIGDATRKIGDYFRMYSNHSRIILKFVELGFDVLPSIIWRKTANAPNKFMGSGMLPSGAYVTLEHEHILIFRKGGRRIFSSPEEKAARNESAYFWEERNKWFVDTWDLNGVLQKMKTEKTRSRSAAYPFEIPYRLINMYSCIGDTIFDPFLGTGTSSFAAAICRRDSIGYEIEESFKDVIFSGFDKIGNESFLLCRSRLENHAEFIRKYILKKGNTKHDNSCYGFPVITSQETHLKLSYIEETIKNDSKITAFHKVFEKDDSIPMFLNPVDEKDSQTLLFG